MKRYDFQALLTDLYQLYNPTKINDVNFLMEKYAGQEFDAIQMVYIKYNQKNHPHYNPNVTEEFIQSLIEKYNNKDRCLSAENIALLKNEDEIETIKKNSEEREKEKKQLTEEIEKELRTKIFKELDKEKPENPLKGFEIKVSNYYVDSEIKLPAPIILLYMGIGSKFICRNEARKIIPLCVQDITMDLVTDSENPVIEITINEAKLND